MGSPDSIENQVGRIQFVQSEELHGLQPPDYYFRHFFPAIEADEAQNRQYLRQRPNLRQNILDMLGLGHFTGNGGGICYMCKESIKCQIKTHIATRHSQIIAHGCLFCEYTPQITIPKFNLTNLIAHMKHCHPTEISNLRDYVSYAPDLVVWPRKHGGKKFGCPCGVTTMDEMCSCVGCGQYWHKVCAEFSPPGDMWLCERCTTNGTQPIPEEELIRCPCNVDVAGAHGLNFS